MTSSGAIGAIAKALEIANRHTVDDTEIYYRPEIGFVAFRPTPRHGKLAYMMIEEKKQKEEKPKPTPRNRYERRKLLKTGKL